MRMAADILAGSAAAALDLPAASPLIAASAFVVDLLTKRVTKKVRLRVQQRSCAVAVRQDGKSVQSGLTYADEVIE